MIALPLVAVLLFLFFRAITATLLPVRVAFFAIPTSLAVLRLLTNVMDISVFALNVASFIGIGLAIDYSLLIVTRFREELGLGQTDDLALRRTMNTAGREILVPGVTVAASLSALLIFPLVILRTIGLAGILVVLCAMLGALVLLPNLLHRVGSKVRAIDPHAANPFGRWVRVFAQVVMRRPVVETLVTTTLLLAFGAPMLRMKSAMPDVRVFPPESEVRRVDEMLESKLGFSAVPLTPIFIAARSLTAFENPGEIAHLIAYAKHLAKLPGVERVTSPFVQGPLADPKIAEAAISRPQTLPSEQ